MAANLALSEWPKSCAQTGALRKRYFAPSPVIEKVSRVEFHLFLHQRNFRHIRIIHVFSKVGSRRQGLDPKTHTGGYARCVYERQ